MNAILFLIDEFESDEPAALAETLRAALFSADVVLIPSLNEVAAIAAVITRALFGTDRRDELSSGADRRDESSRRRSIGRIVTFGAGVEDRSLAATLVRFSPTDSSPRPIDAFDEPRPLTLEDAMRRYKPERVVVLGAAIGSGDVEVVRDRAEILFFSQLSPRPDLDRRRGVGGRFRDLGANWVSLGRPDAETGRFDDSATEPFTPYGLLFQEAIEAERDADR